MHRKIRSVLVFLVLAPVLIGCGLGNIDNVRRGMMPVQVEQIMGEPLQVVRGDGVDLDKKTYVYPAGRIHFVNQQVVEVEKAGEEDTLTGRYRQFRDENR